MPKFKVGDIITGAKPNIPYSITTNRATMEVVEISNDGTDNIRVKVIKHKENLKQIGQGWTVSAKYFKKIEDNKIKKTMTDKPVYWECKDNGHSKFWAAHIIKRDNMFTLVRKWGRIGNNPQTMDQEFNTYSEAENILDDLIQEKERKGYKAIF